LNILNLTLLKSFDCLNMNVAELCQLSSIDLIARSS
jgi:hypothetical protein